MIIIISTVRHRNDWRFYPLFSFQAGRSSAPTSVPVQNQCGSATSKCPIRVLDQNNNEEIMKLSVSAYRAHASAHKKILDTAYQLNYGSTSASHPHPASSGAAGVPTCSGFQVGFNISFIHTYIYIYIYISTEYTKLDAPMILQDNKKCDWRFEAWD